MVTGAVVLAVAVGRCAGKRKRGRNKINNLSTDAAGAVAQAGGIGGWGPMAAHVCLRGSPLPFLNFHIRLSVTEHRVHRSTVGPLCPLLPLLACCLSTFPLVSLASLVLGRLLFLCGVSSMGPKNHARIPSSIPDPSHRPARPGGLGPFLL